MSILDIFKMGARREAEAGSGAETEAVRKIARALDEIEPERAKFIAAFAYLLGRVARTDLEISQKEVDAMEKLVMRQGNLPEEQAVLVVQIAKTQNVLFGGTENYLVTREFNKIATHAEKLALLRCLFAVCSAEDMISTVEDNEVSQIADELRIEHREFIAVRSEFRAHLAVLRDSQSLDD